MASVGEVCFWSFPSPYSEVVLDLGQLNKGEVEEVESCPAPRGSPELWGHPGMVPLAWREGLGLPGVPRGLLQLSLLLSSNR